MRALWPNEKQQDAYEKPKALKSFLIIIVYGIIVNVEFLEVT